QASSSGRGPSGAVREAEEAQAGGGARIINTAGRRSSETVSTARAIAALMAEAGLARGHRTAAGLPSGRPDGRNGLRSYYHCRRVSADGKWFLRRGGEGGGRDGAGDKQGERGGGLGAAGRRAQRGGREG